MFTYRFRMNFEEQEGFSRDIELKTDQTFLDFYTIIMENLSLDKSLECTFYMCDHRYRKRQRIYHPDFLPTTKDKRQQQEDGDIGPTLFMNKSILSDLIDDPHQKFIFIYDVPKEWSFYIELIKISPQSSGNEYPRIVASVGPVPIEISRKPVALPGIVDEDEDELATADIDEDEDQDEYPGIEMAMADGEDIEGSFIYEEVQPEGELEEIDDSEFYDDSIEISEDFDDEKS
jgi:hypothetical protein